MFFCARRNRETHVGYSVSVLREIAHGLEEILTSFTIRIDRVDVLDVVSLSVFTVPLLEDLLAIFVYIYKIVNILYGNVVVDTSVVRFVAAVVNPSWMAL